ncbi:MAG TPA: hypothetical protein DCX06_01240 [Opitutae bacterium]|nr:hypothetical protein [Opitutae bacterium]
MKKTLLFASFIALTSTGAFALTASDDASNYGSGWTDGSNGGSGFGLWSLNNNDGGGIAPFAGNFIGDSTAGAGDINTGASQSFGLYANPGAAFSTAIRSFSSALTTNDQFSFNFAVNFDNGNKGFNLRTAGDSIFNFNVGSGASVSSANATLNATLATYDYGGGDAMLEAVLTVISPSSINYLIRRVSGQGAQGDLFTGSVTGITGSIDNFELYVSGTDDGSAQNNLYFNNLDVSVVPEPSAYGLLAGLAALAFVMLRRRV